MLDINMYIFLKINVFFLINELKFLDYLKKTFVNFYILQIFQHNKILQKFKFLNLF